MNELPVSGYPCLRKELWDSSGGKHCKSLVVSMPKNMVLARDQHFFAVVLSQMDFGNVDT